MKRNVIYVNFFVKIRATFRVSLLTLRLPGTIQTPVTTDRSSPSFRSKESICYPKTYISEEQHPVFPHNRKPTLCSRLINMPTKPARFIHVTQPEFSHVKHERAINPEHFHLRKFYVEACLIDTRGEFRAPAKQRHFLHEYAGKTSGNHSRRANFSPLCFVSRSISFRTP